MPSIFWRLFFYLRLASTVRIKLLVTFRKNLKGTGNHQITSKYFLESGFLNNYRFEATDDFYPFYPEFDLNKNEWSYSQTNSRGYKEMKFNLKRKGN